MKVGSPDPNTHRPPAPRRTPTIVQRAAHGLVFLVVAALVLTLLGIGPVAFVAEAIEMFQMRLKTPATIESVQVETGGKFGAARPIIRFSYTVDGAQHSSNQYSPGFNSNGFWTGGGSAARVFQPGDVCDIHYNPSSPDQACLVYGWHKGTLIFSAFSSLLLFPLVARSWPPLRGRESELAGATLLLWIVPAFFAPSVLSPVVVLLALPAPLLLTLAAIRFGNVGRFLRRFESGKRSRRSRRPR